MANCWNKTEDDSSGDEVYDDDSNNLGPIAMVGYKTLARKQNAHWHECWNVTSGKIIGNAWQTPYGTWNDTGDAPAPIHDKWFPEKMCELISKTTQWCDVTSLGPPDGEFMTQFQKAVAAVANTANTQGGEPITIRMLFGNILGMPVNIEAVLEDLTKYVPEDSNIQMWVGAWRKGVSWNHSKIIAVDGRYLYTGGHNLWDQHYLRRDPVHDISMHAEGRCAHDGHLFANTMWDFIQKTQKSFIGKIISMLPDSLPLVIGERVTVSEFPVGEVDTFPPMYSKSCVSRYNMPPQGQVRMITMGRYGSIYNKDRPSDDAIVAMFNKAKTIIRMSLQDVGPITIPNLPGPQAVPGCCWPKPYLEAWGRAIYERGVDVEIALSNPGSIPNGLKPTEALYGNGWTCAQVASEIVKAARDFAGSDNSDERLRKMVEENLRICYVKQAQNKYWSDKQTKGNHAKHWIIDDECYYVGSQNLYVCDLAEWGCLVDDKAQTNKMMDDYWRPMWTASYTPDDCDVNEVMNGLDIDRDGEDESYATPEQLRQAHFSMAKHPGAGSSHMYDDDDAELDKHHDKHGAQFS